MFEQTAGSLTGVEYNYEDKYYLPCQEMNSKYEERIYVWERKKGEDGPTLS